MFDRFRKRAIEIVCPSCNGGQTEPALAFSTFCRHCNTHLKIVKGVARINSTIQSSGLSEVRDLDQFQAFQKRRAEELESEIASSEAVPEDTEAKVDADRERKDLNDQVNQRQKSKRRRAREEAKLKENQAADELRAEIGVSDDSMVESSFAEVFGLTDEGAAAELSEAELEEQSVLECDVKLGDMAVDSFEPKDDGSMGAMLTDLVDQEEKREIARAAHDEESDHDSTDQNQRLNGAPVSDDEMRKPIAAKRSTREISKSQITVRCFRCHHRQWESKYAESTQCGRCNTYISLADHQIRRRTDRVIRTRGNITVSRRGTLEGRNIACRNLIVGGKIDTQLDVSGEARFKSSGIARGHLFCCTLVIEKSIIVEFPDGVHAEDVEIFGTLRGDVTSAGTVTIHRSGILDGDVVARELDLPDGGTLTGEMSLDPEVTMDIEVVKGGDSSVIE